MDIAEVIKQLAPVAEWKTVGNPTGQVAGAIGDHGYQKTEIGRHGNHVYQVLHYASGHVVFCIDRVAEGTEPEGVEAFIKSGVVDLQKMADLTEGYEQTLVVEFGPDGRVVSGQVHHRDA